MAGPGLVFALALSCVLPAGAETAVGLDAKGVDPMVAVANPNGLDVRDELGRPVSARLVEAGLKDAQTKAAVQTAAFSSSLRDAAAVAALAEMLEALRLALRAGGAGDIPQRVYALAPSLRSVDKSLVPTILLVAFSMLVARCRRPTALSALRDNSRIPIVLRC